MTAGSRKIRMGMEVNRVEGDMEIQVEVERGVVTDAWCSGTMFRGYEQILTGRDPADALVVTPRICGICSTSHLYGATSALETAYSAPIAPNGTRIRNLCLMAAAGRRGHWEESFIGLELKDLENPVELYHVVRSHDACLVCTVHFLRADTAMTFHL